MAKMLVSGIKPSFFVRKALNDDHVLYLACLIEGGTQLPPITINSAGEVMDGRHRIEAYKLNGIETVEVEMSKLKTHSEQLAFAMKANVGGALPPTPEDIRFVVGQLLEDGATERQIMDMMPFPRSVTRKYVVTARANVTRRKLKQAQEAVSNNVPIKDAATRFDVDPDELAAAVRGDKRDRKRVGGNIKLVKGGITSQYRSTSQKNARLLQEMADGVEDGTVPVKAALEVVEHILKAVQQQGDSVRHWRDRIVAAGKPFAKAVGA